jgi:hypothetical protein
MAENRPEQLSFSFMSMLPLSRKPSSIHGTNTEEVLVDHQPWCNVMGVMVGENCPMCDDYRAKSVDCKLVCPNCYTILANCKED